MKNFSKGLLIVFVLVIFFAISRAMNLREYSSFFATILGTSTFIFGVFTTFSITDRRARIDKIRENDSEERSQLLSLSLSSRQIGKEFHESVNKKIDEYLMATLDFKIWDYHLTQKYYDDLFEKVLKFEPESNKDKALFGNMISGMTKILSCRKSTIGLIDDRLSNFEWLVSAFLSIVILACLSALNSGSNISFIVILFLSLALALLLSLLYSLDSLAWKEEERIFEPYEKTFETLGLERYYPEALIKQKRVTKHIGKKYRMGIISKPYPDMSEKRIKLIEK